MHLFSAVDNYRLWQTEKEVGTNRELGCIILHLCWTAFRLEQKTVAHSNSKGQWLQDRQNTLKGIFEMIFGRCFYLGWPRCTLGIKPMILQLQAPKKQTFGYFKGSFNANHLKCSIYQEFVHLYAQPMGKRIRVSKLVLLAATFQKPPGMLEC